MSQTEQLSLSEFQQRVMMIPEEFDIALTGGRGGGKSYCLATIALRYMAQHKRRGKVLFVRKTHKGCNDFETICLDLFTQVYGRQLKYNSVERLFRTPDLGTLEINQLESPSDYSKYQGRSFGLIMVDECGQFSTPELIDKLRSNMRAPLDTPTRMILSSNPGDFGHQWLYERYAKQAPWQPYFEPQSKRFFVTAPSTFEDNDFINKQEYRQQLESATATDDELQKAWIYGRWDISRGAFFSNVLNEQRNKIEPWPCLPQFDSERDLGHLLPSKRQALARSGWYFYLSMDYGSAAPAVVYVCAESPGAEYMGRYYPRGSVVLVDELNTSVPNNISAGLNWTVPQLADAIKHLCKSWNIRPQGVADDACFSNFGSQAGSIAQEFKAQGVRFDRAQKGDRISGWERMRRMLADAGSVDLPGLYISRNCELFWQTVPFLGRDPKRIQDVDTQGNDHAADSARYALGHTKPYEATIKLYGT